tara:strand:- start:36 stop:455 length:420 start_codon:yes stop_codon:yes gene_type:complete
MSLVTVIIPYFNKKHFIKRTLNSVLNQNYHNIEVIIIYDDKDLKDYFYLKDLIKKFKKFKKIKLIINKKNFGAGHARNVGIGYAKGKYLAFIDADDIWKKNKLKKQINFMKAKSHSISHTSYDIINKDGKKDKKDLNVH